MAIKLIVAVNEDFAIGYKNKLLYHIDLQHFKKLTTENEYGLKNFVLFGRKSYESLPNKPLSERVNVVLTSNKNYESNNHNIIIVNSLDQIINHYSSGEQQKTLWICGGSTVYEQSIPFVDCVYMTYIYDSGVEADTYFNREWLDEFEEVERVHHFSEKYKCRYDFITYKRIKDEN